MRKKLVCSWKMISRCWQLANHCASEHLRRNLYFCTVYVYDPNQHAQGSAQLFKAAAAVYTSSNKESDLFQKSLSKFGMCLKEINNNGWANGSIIGIQLDF